MNHIYHSIWNEALGAWIAVSEIATGQGKRAANRRKKPMTASPLKDWQSSSPLLATGLLLCSSASWALPTGNELVAGQATVTTPTAGQMQINQASQNAIINWQGFSIDQNQAVNIQQPNTQAALLNRVVGQDASQIQGQLNANGQVYLVNPNGVLFSKTAQVDVGGLIASTHNISNADFMNGNHHFIQNGATGSIDNQGNIKTPEGGIVALIGKQVTNSGTIETPKGTTALAAGKTVDLDFQGNGLIEVKVTEAALNAQITNQGAIQADGGHVILTANAAGQLIDTVINSQGVIQARGLVERNGVIKLSGGNTGAVEIGGIIDTSGNSNLGLNSKGGDISVTGANINLQNTANLNASGNTGGGIITLGDKQTTNQTTIQQGATVTANTLNNGTAGTINVLASMNDGKVQVDGQLNAAAPKNGDGGFIDTSAAHVNVADTAKISTKANNGKTGKWLIDPTDYKIAASGGNLTGTALANYLNASNVEIQTLATGSTGQGDIFVNDAVTWNNFNELTLTAHRNVNVNAAINALGGGSVRLRADSLGTGTGTVAFTGTGHIAVNNGAAVGIYYNPVSYTDAATKSDSSGNPYSSKVTLNSGSTLTSYMLVNDVNKLQAMNTNLNGNYALGKNIDASATAGWNGGAGFVPVGTGGWQQSGSLAFRGKFSGLNHTISGLFINRPATDNVALFGTVFNPAVISNIGLVGGSIRGQSSVGSLIGWNENGKVIDSYATTEIFGSGANIGGLMGVNSWSGLISGSYATGNVTGSGNAGSVGGLSGHNQGVITNSFATGAVIGGQRVGGLVGQNYTNSGRITNSYSTGSVSGTTSVGGLVGNNSSTTNTSNYWDKQTSGKTTSASGTGLTTAQMKQQASFTGWDFVNTWQINQGVSYPTLRAFNTQTVTPVTPTPPPVTNPPVTNPPVTNPPVPPTIILRPDGEYNSALYVINTKPSVTEPLVDVPCQSNGSCVDIIDVASDIFDADKPILDAISDVNSVNDLVQNKIFEGIDSGIKNLILTIRSHKLNILDNYRLIEKYNIQIKDLKTGNPEAIKVRKLIAALQKETNILKTEAKGLAKELKNLPIAEGLSTLTTFIDAIDAFKLLGKAMAGQATGADLEAPIENTAIAISLLTRFEKTSFGGTKLANVGGALATIKAAVAAGEIVARLSGAMSYDDATKMTLDVLQNDIQSSVVDGINMMKMGREGNISDAKAQQLALAYSMKVGSMVNEIGTIVENRMSFSPVITSMVSGRLSQLSSDTKELVNIQKEMLKFDYNYFYSMFKIGQDATQAQQVISVIKAM